jgi:hypothetical protein
MGMAAVGKTDHRVHLLFDFAFEGQDAADRLTGIRLAQAASHDLVHPSRLTVESQRPIGDAPLWEWAPWDVSPDFHPFMRGVLDSASGGQPADQPRCLRQSQSSVALVQGRYRHASGVRPEATGMVLALGRSPRITSVPEWSPVLIDGGSAGVAVQVQIESITSHVFQTGTGLVVATVRLVPRERDADIPPDLLVELVPRLGDERRVASLRWLDEWTSPDAAKFSFGQLAARLIEPAGCEITARERVYTYCTVVAGVSLNSSRARDVAFRLSRHYGAAYHPTDDFAGTHFAHPFETVLHAASREGACTLVIPDAHPDSEPVEFLRTWINQADPHVYLPLQIAAFHEYAALLRMAQGAGMHIDPGAHDSATIQALKDLAHRFLLFRLRYRMLQVSGITLHELAYVATVKALDIDALSAKIARDLVEVERRLIALAEDHAQARRKAAAEREHERERSAAWFAGVASGALTYITMASLFDHLAEFLEHWAHLKAWEPFAAIPSPNIRLPEFFHEVRHLELTTVVRVLGQLLGVGLGAYSLRYAMRRQRAGHPEIDHATEHEAVELRLARSHSGAHEEARS